MPNRLSLFWQELKRRKVVRVITVYAGAAFVILELVDIIADPLKLPTWLLPVVIVLLSIGFIIAVILSWIYDIHPEGGMVKTEPADRVKVEDVHKPSNNWKIASYTSFVVIVGLIVLNIIPRIGKKEIFEKSIAVLPFKYLSDETDKQYLADGAMDEIILNLSKIEDLRVLARTSVEQYRVTDMTATEICQELDVAFVLEGSFLKNGDQVRLIVQLIQPGLEGHVWSRKFDRNWQDIFTVQSEVAQLVANELQAVITPEEKLLIEKIPTTSLTAYEIYQRGRQEYIMGTGFKYDSEALDRAKYYYHKALEYDSTFARAYTGLAWVHFSESHKDKYFSETYMDSLLILAEIALSYDSQLSVAYSIRGRYFWIRGELEKALNENNRALELNPNDWMAYLHRGHYYYWTNNPVRSLDDYHKAAFLNRGVGLSEILGYMANAYSEGLGFIQKGLIYNQQALELDGDSARYYDFLGTSEVLLGNYTKATEIFKQGIEIDSNHLGMLDALGECYLYLGELEESFKYYEKHVKKIESKEEQDFFVLNNWHRIGYVYLKNGNLMEAESFFDRQFEYCAKSIELNRPYGLQYVYYDLAALSAFQEQKIKALDNLNVFIHKGEIKFFMLTQIRRDPLFDNIRGEPEFQRIVVEMEAKYRAVHERVRQWLEENDRL